MRPLNILAIQRTSAADRARIEAVDPAIHLTDAGGWFDDEMRQTWPAFTAERYLPPPTATPDRSTRDRLLAEADVVLGGFPFPLDLRARAPRLQWFHQRPAGASNLLRGDLWGSDVIVTTSRGAASSLAIAEYALAAIFHLAKGLSHAATDRLEGRFHARAYRPILLDGKTACVIGAGGIGQQLGRLFAAIGMQVLGTRRHMAADMPAGFTEMGTPADLDRFLPRSDVVAICCQWTPETDKLLDHARFALLKPDAMMVNVARGEIIDEAALVEALAANRLRGVALDVYVGEFEGPPAAALWSDPRVLVTPHISGAADDNRHAGTDVFCRNLRAFLDGDPLHNVVDWQRGY
jgi:glyoxylate/hydroxypyruvate reductase